MRVHPISWWLTRVYFTSKPVRPVLQLYAQKTHTVLWMWLRPQAYNFVKKQTLAQVFSCEFCEISKNMFSYRRPLVAASLSDENGFFRWKITKRQCSFIKKETLAQVNTPVNFVKFLKTPFHRTPLGDCFFIRWKWFFPMKKLQKVNVVRIMYQLLKTNKNSNKDLINRTYQKDKIVLK